MCNSETTLGFTHTELYKQCTLMVIADSVLQHRKHIRLSWWSQDSELHPNVGTYCATYSY